MRRGVVLLLAVTLGAVSSTAAGQGVQVSTVQLPPDRTIDRVLFADADGDGREDLLIVASGPPRRSVYVHLRRPSGALFVNEPDRVIDLPENVIACAVGDVHPHPGPELVLFAPRTVVAVWMAAADDERGGARLLATDILWQLPSTHHIVDWQHGLRDIDGDGRTDLLIPRPQGYLLALAHTADASFREFLLDLPPPPPKALLDPERRGGSGRTDHSFELSLQLSNSDRPESLLSVDDVVPSPHLADWNADGNLDVVVQTGTSLVVWLQDPSGVFNRAPTHVFPLPVKLDWADLDVSYRSHLADLNGDARADYVLIASDRFSKETRAQVLPYIQRADAAADASLFDTAGPPRALLPSGFVPASRVHDVDGDGRPDLILGTFRPESMRPDARGGGGATVNAELFVYRNDGHGFATSPLVRHPMRIDLDGGDTSARFLVDLTGDGVRDLVIRDEPRVVRVLPVERARDGGLRIRDRAIWTLKIDPDARVEFVDVGPERGELLVVESSQVIHVRLR